MNIQTVITTSLLFLMMSISGSILAQADLTKTEKPIVRNSIYYKTAERGPYSLTFQISKLKNNNGAVMLRLVDENGKLLAETKSPIVDRICTAAIDSLPAGNYAIRYYHDENGNGEMDSSTFGIPKEGYGFSNNARGFMGPPDLEDMIFKLEQDLKLKMKTVN
jgi:uncharacterized protein (DUF2141 family)